MEQTAAGGGDDDDDEAAGEVAAGARARVRTAPARLSRQPAPPQSPPAQAPPGQAPAAGADVKNKEGILDGMHISTYAEAAEFLTSRAAEIEKERAAILEDGAPAPAALFNVAAEARTLAGTCRAGGSGPIDEATYDQVDAWYLKAVPAMEEAENARLLIAAQKMREIRQKALSAEATIKQTQDKIADKRAAAFAKGDSSILGDIWSWSTALLDSGLAIKPVVEESAEMEQSFRTAAKAAAAQGGPNQGKINASFKTADGSKVLPLLDKVNTAIAAFQAVSAAADLVASKKSKSEKAKSDIKASVGLVSAVGTLIGASSSISLLLNLHIGPMTDACLNALGKLEDVARKINRELIQLGQYDKVNWDLEQGGREVFDFMLKVRSASGPEDVPSPVPAEVSKYFAENQDEIQAGVTGNKEGDEMPTTGWWFWKKVDQNKIGKWVFSHRQYLWEIFYGSTKPAG